nr:tripartite tricarboxylate transporter substrate-binding protein [Aquabacterium terrae]
MRARWPPWPSPRRRSRSTRRTSCRCRPRPRARRESAEGQARFALVAGALALGGEARAADKPYPQCVITLVVPLSPAASSTSRPVSSLVERGRSEPGRISFGSGGNGTSSRLCLELLQTTTGARFTHVPHKSASAALVGFCDQPAPSLGSIHRKPSSFPMWA